MLNCSVLGHDVERVFEVLVSTRGSINKLKDVIKKVMEPELDHIDAYQLDIWKVTDSGRRGNILTITNV